MSADTQSGRGRPGAEAVWSGRGIRAAGRDLPERGTRPVRGRLLAEGSIPGTRRQHHAGSASLRPGEAALWTAIRATLWEVVEGYEHGAVSQWQYRRRTSPRQSDRDRARAYHFATGRARHAVAGNADPARATARARITCRRAGRVRVRPGIARPFTGAGPRLPRASEERGVCGAEGEWSWHSYTQRPGDRDDLAAELHPIAGWRCAGGRAPLGVPAGETGGEPIAVAILRRAAQFAPSLSRRPRPQNVALDGEGGRRHRRRQIGKSSALTPHCRFQRNCG